MNLSAADISAIAVEVAKQLRPMLAPQPTAVEVKQTGASLEIAQVRAAGIDPFQYLRDRSKKPRNPIRRRG